jgi:hypothetical protein
VALTAASSIVDTATTKRLALINRAVQSLPAPVYFDYSAGFENPFKLWNEQRIAASQAARSDTTAHTRVMLSLKGILIKDPPLAILDNGMGETQIRAVGEKAFDQFIVNISENSVTLRDKFGKYEITVEER